MSGKEIALLAILVLAVFGEARHTHPRIEQWEDTSQSRANEMSEHDPSSSSAVVNHDAKETEIPKHKFKITPPISILFFKSFNPCEEGFEQDYQGICREVWF